MDVKPIPEGYHTVTPYLVVDGADKLIDFLKQAFGAEERFRMAGDGDRVGHAEVAIGDSVIMMGDAATAPSGRSFPAMIHLYVENADEMYRKALEAGATSLREPADQFYGDRTGGVTDPFGNQWWIATHVEDVPPDEIARRAEAAREQV